MSTFVYPQASELAQAALLSARYNAAKMDLLQAPITLGPNITLADCVAQVATFTGYAQVVTPASNPVPFPDPVRQGVSFTVPTSNFVVGSTPTVGNSIYGLYIQTATGSNLIFVLLFNTPYPMQEAGDAMNIELTVNQYGDGQIACTINGVPA